MTFSISKQLHINNHLKAHFMHLEYKSYPRALGTEDLVYGGTGTHNIVVESPNLTLGHTPLPMTLHDIIGDFT